jgi:hypothetical protein
MTVTARTLRRWSVLALLSAAVLSLGGLTVAPMSYAAADDSVIYVVQGLPGRSVDIAFDDKTVARDVGTAEVVGPFTIKAGKRKATFSEGGKVLLEGMFTANAGASCDAVLHLPATPDDHPTVTVFENDLSKVPRGMASLTVAHTARVGEADVRVNDKVAFANIANGQSLNVVVPVATYKVTIVPAGKTEPVVFGPVSLTVKGGALNRVYAIGDPSQKTMNVAVHVIDTGFRGSAQPDRVNTGTGGQAEALQPSRPALWH